jgi:cytochrome c553
MQFPKRIATAFSVALLLCGSANAQTATGDAKAGKVLAQSTCAACHGINGKGISQDFPNLAAQFPEYLAKQLRAFKAPAGGRAHRKSEVMQPIAAPLGVQDERVQDRLQTLVAGPPIGVQDGVEQRLWVLSGKGLGHVGCI